MNEPFTGRRCWHDIHNQKKSRFPAPDQTLALVTSEANGRLISSSTSGKVSQLVARSYRNALNIRTDNFPPKCDRYLVENYDKKINTFITISCTYVFCICIMYFVSYVSEESTSFFPLQRLQS